MAAALKATDGLLDLTEDERDLLALLVVNGGAMPQTEVVASVDYSKSKLSQLVTSLRDDDHLEVVTVGRRNFLYLPGCAPASADAVGGGAA